MERMRNGRVTIGERLQRIESLLTGNGLPERGIIVRLDRVEQSLAALKWMVRVVLGGMLAAAGGGLWALLKW